MGHSVDNKFVRCEPDDPKRCQAVCRGNTGQCPYTAIENSQYCHMHCGPVQANAEKAKAIRMYRLSQYRDRVNELADHDKVKSLREEIGILRVMLEELVNSCKTSLDLMLNTNKISDLVVKIEKLVSSCHRLEQSTGMLLDKQSALHLASIIVNIISEHVEDGDAIDKIANQIMTQILTPTPVDKK